LNSKGPTFSWLVWGGLAMVAVTLLAVYTLQKRRLAGPPTRPLAVYGQVAEFTLTNQEGRVFSLADLRGHVWAGDIIFTQCAGPCPRMTRQMKELQDALPAGSNARLVTLTTDPANDSPAVLKKYAARFGADSNRWSFLTGTKSEIAKLAIDSLKLTAIEKKPEERDAPEDLFIHSTIFVLVDKKAQLRSVFETTGEQVDFQQVKYEILRAINQLEKE
jgi:protein SCO1/2